MRCIKETTKVFDNQQQLQEIVLDYFSDICASENSYEKNDMVSQVIFKLVIGDNNAMITNIPSMEEVKSAVFSLNGDGAPSPDRFWWMFSLAFLLYCSY